MTTKPVAELESTLAATKASLNALAAEAAAFRPPGAESITDIVAAWLTPHYAVAVREQLATAQGPQKLKILHECVQGCSLLRRGDQYAERLRIEREQLALARQRLAEEQEKLFLEWATKPENRERICRGAALSPEEKAQRIREIFGVKTKGRGGLAAGTLETIEKEANLL